VSRAFDLSRFRSTRSQEEVKEREPAPRRERARRKRPFVLVDLEAAAQVAAATQRSTGAFVWLLIQYLAWRDKSETVALTNQSLVPYGINRFAKHRAVADLEKAGLIQVERQGTKTVLVTLVAGNEG
jgi:hypothetical protein